MAAGPALTVLPLAADGRSDAAMAFRDAMPPDLDQTHGLDAADISPREQGTLLMPPTPAIAFRTPPNTRTPLA